MSDRTPEQIIGSDACTQLAFEGYEIVKSTDIARLRSALAFYADSATYIPPAIGWSPIGNDKGRKARAALSDTAQSLEASDD